MKHFTETASQNRHQPLHLITIALDILKKLQTRIQCNILKAHDGFMSSFCFIFQRFLARTWCIKFLILVLTCKISLLLNLCVNLEMPALSDLFHEHTGDLCITIFSQGQGFHIHIWTMGDPCLVFLFRLQNESSIKFELKVTIEGEMNNTIKTQYKNLLASKRTRAQGN